MDWKRFLEPNKKKILISILLFIGTIVLSFLAPYALSLLINPILINLGKLEMASGLITLFYPLLISFSVYVALTMSILRLKVLLNTPLYLVLPILVMAINFALVAYPVACYMSENKRWAKGIVIYLIAFTVVSSGMGLAIYAYNETYGNSCDSDSDCGLVCHTSSAFSYRSIPYSGGDCVQPAVCKKNRCTYSTLGDVKSVGDCERLWPGDPDTCYRDLAIKLDDLSLCDKLTSELYPKSECYSQVYTSLAYKLKDVNMCYKITEIGFKGDCYIGVAKRTKNSSICELYKATVDYCYEEVALELNDSNLCDKIENKGYKVQCYTNLARN